MKEMVKDEAVTDREIQRFLKKVGARLKSNKIDPDTFRFMLSADGGMLDHVANQAANFARDYAAMIHTYAKTNRVLAVDYNMDITQEFEGFSKKLNDGNHSIGMILRGSYARSLPFKISDAKHWRKGVKRIRVRELDPCQEKSGTDLSYVISLLKKLNDRSNPDREFWQFTGFQETIFYILEHGKEVYKEFHAINSMFWVDNQYYRLRYGMVPDNMDMRPEGPIFEVYPVIPEGPGYTGSLKGRYAYQDEVQSGDVFLIHHNF